MQTPTATFPGAAADGVLGRAVDARARVLRAEADQLAAVLDWALLHATDDPDAAAVEPLGQGRSVPLAGDGTPWVAEFALPELAAALGLSHGSARRLVGDALELAFRLPLLWARVQSGQLPAWRARRVAQHTSALSVEAAGWFDRQIAPFAHRLPEARVLDLVETARLRHDARDPEPQEPSDGRGVDVVDLDGGQSLLRAVVDAVDGHALESTLTKVAATLAALGDDAPVQVRRATALGILADPQLTLDLLTGTETDPAHRTRTTPGNTPTAATQLTLYVHVSAADLAAGTGVARVEGIGPLPLTRLRAWAGASRLTVRPLVDLAADYVADSYAVPDRIREQVLARDPACVFPWCSARTHSRDIDHIVAYDDTGPPGQSRSSNLAPLCRFHHRLKTHSDWTYRRHPDGSYHWQSPHGRDYTVTPEGTHPH